MPALVTHVDAIFPKLMRIKLFFNYLIIIQLDVGGEGESIKMQTHANGEGMGVMSVQT